MRCDDWKQISMHSYTNILVNKFIRLKKDSPLFIHIVYAEWGTFFPQFIWLLCALAFVCVVNFIWLRLHENNCAIWIVIQPYGLSKHWNMFIFSVHKEKIMSILTYKWKFMRLRFYFPATYICGIFLCVVGKFEKLFRYIFLWQINTIKIICVEMNRINST